MDKECVVERGFSFEKEWPATSELLAAALRRRRIPATLIDDLVQETGLRLLQKWACVDPERGTWPLAYTIAMNILKDQVRADVRRQKVVPPAPRYDDPEVVALARIELDEVRDALAELSPAQRTALLAEVGTVTASERSSAAEKMLRMRARKRLRMLTRDTSGIAAWVEVVLHRWIDRLQGAGASSMLQATAPFAAGLVSLATFVGATSASAIVERANVGSETAIARLAAGSATQLTNDMETALAALMEGDVHTSTVDGGDIRLVRSVTTTSDDKVKASRRDRKKKEKSRSIEETVKEPGLAAPELPDAFGELPSSGGADTQPVKVESEDASAGADGASVGADASAGGHDFSGGAGVSGEGGDSAGDSLTAPSVEVEGGAQLDDEVVVELG